MDGVGDGEDEDDEKKMAEGEEEEEEGELARERVVAHNPRKRFGPDAPVKLATTTESDYGSHLLAGEGSAMAHFIQSVCLDCFCLGKVSFFVPRLCLLNQIW